MKGNSKCKNFRLEPPFGGLRGNAQGSSMARVGANWIRSQTLMAAAL